MKPPQSCYFSLFTRVRVWACFFVPPCVAVLVYSFCLLLRCRMHICHRFCCRCGGSIREWYPCPSTSVDTIDTGIYRHGDLSTWGSIDSAIYRHGDLSTWGSIDTAIYRHGDLSTRGFIDMGIYRHGDLSTRGSIDSGIYRHGDLSTRRSIDMGIYHARNYRHRDLSTRGSIDTGIYRHGDLSTRGSINTGIYRHEHLIIIIINPLTAKVVGAPQMILQPVFSIFPCSPLPSGTCRTPGLSIP